MPDLCTQIFYYHIAYKQGSFSGGFQHLSIQPQHTGGLTKPNYPAIMVVIVLLVHASSYDQNGCCGVFLCVCFCCCCFFPMFSASSVQKYRLKIIESCNRWSSSSTPSACRQGCWLLGKALDWNMSQEIDHLHDDNHISEAYFSL